MSDDSNAPKRPFVIPRRLVPEDMIAPRIEDQVLAALKAKFPHKADDIVQVGYEEESFDRKGPIIGGNGTYTVLTNWNLLSPEDMDTLGLKEGEHYTKRPKGMSVTAYRISQAALETAIPEIKQPQKGR